MKNLPTVGEGDMLLALHDLHATVGLVFETANVITQNYCIQKDANTLDLDLRRLQVIHPSFPWYIHSPTIFVRDPI